MLASGLTAMISLWVAWLLSETGVFCGAAHMTPLQAAPAWELNCLACVLRIWHSLAHGSHLADHLWLQEKYQGPNVCQGLVAGNSDRPLTVLSLLHLCKGKAVTL